MRTFKEFLNESSSITLDAFINDRRTIKDAVTTTDKLVEFFIKRRIKHQDIKMILLDDDLYEILSEIIQNDYMFDKIYTQNYTLCTWEKPFPLGKININMPKYKSMKSYMISAKDEKYLRHKYRGRINGEKYGI